MIYSIINKFWMDQFQNIPFLGLYNFQTLSQQNQFFSLADFHHLNVLIAENARITALNATLQQQIKMLSESNKKLKSEKMELKRDEESQFRLEKRRYTPRREGLEKNLKCGIEECPKSYSSAIALSNHQRKAHKLTKTTKKLLK